MNHEQLISRVRQYLGKASFASGIDRYAALECLDEITVLYQAQQVEIERLNQENTSLNQVLDLRDLIDRDH